MNTDHATIDSTTSAASELPQTNPLPAIGQRCAETVRTMPRPLRLLSAGAGLCAFGSLMPWGYLHSSGSVAATQRTSAGTLALLVMSAAVVWAAFPAMHGVLARKRLGLLAGLVGLTGVFTLGGWVMVSQLAKSTPDPTASLNAMLGIHEHATASPGFGLVLWTAGTAAMALGSLWIWRSQRHASGLAS
jgi:hypothetical protein